jgi:hypothetical protein
MYDAICGATISPATTPSGRITSRTVGPNQARNDTGAINRYRALKPGRNHREDLPRARLAFARKRFPSGGLCSTRTPRAALYSNSDTDTWNAPSCPTGPGATGARSGGGSIVIAFGTKNASSTNV